MFLTTPTSVFMPSFRKGQSIAYLLKSKANLLDFHKILLPYFWPEFSFYTLWKHQKTFG